MTYGIRSLDAAQSRYQIRLQSTAAAQGPGVHYGEQPRLPDKPIVLNFPAPANGLWLDPKYRSCNVKLASLRA